MTAGKIYRYEYSLLIILSLVGSVFLVSLQESVIGKDTYIALIFGLIMGIALNILFLFVLKNCGFKPFAEVNTMLFGKAGNTVTLFFSFYFLLSSALLLDYYGTFTVRTILEDMPVTVLFVAITAVIMLASLKGITTMGRMGVIFSYVLFFCVIFSFLLELPHVNADNLAPAFSSDPHDMFDMAVLFGFLQFGDILSVLCLTSHVDKKHHLIRLSVLSTAIGGGVVFVFCFLNAACLGDSLLYQYSGFFRIMKIVDLGSIFNRFEVLVVAGYFFATVFRLMIEFFVVTDNISNVFCAKKDPRIKWGILISCSVIFVLFAVFIASEAFIWDIYPFFAVVFQAALPLVMLFLSKRFKQRCLLSCRG